MTKSRSTLTPFNVRFWSQTSIYLTELDSSGQALLTSHPPFCFDREEIWNRVSLIGWIFVIMRLMLISHQFPLVKQALKSLSASTRKRKIVFLYFSHKCEPGFSKPRRQRQRGGHQTQVFLSNTIAVHVRCIFLCRPQQNNNVKWQRRYYFKLPSKAACFRTFWQLWPFPPHYCLSLFHKLTVFLFL